MGHTLRGSPLFQASSSYGNVVLNVLRNADHELGLYAHAFHKAGQILAEQMFDRAGYSSLEACPIVFLYRHALELYLKAIVLNGDEIMQIHGETLTSRSRLLRTHRLLPLFLLVKRTYDAVEWTWHDDIEGLRTFEEVEEMLRAFEAVDPGSHTFRYPVDTDGQPSVPHHFMFHMPTFCTRMDAFLNALEAAVMGLEMARDLMLEAAYYMQDQDNAYTSDEEAPTYYVEG